MLTFVLCDYPPLVREKRYARKVYVGRLASKTNWVTKHTHIIVVVLLFFLYAQDAGLEGMAMEVGTLQGGQIAALQDGKEGALGKPPHNFRQGVYGGEKVRYLSQQHDALVCSFLGVSITAVVQVLVSTIERRVGSTLFCA